MSDAFRSILPAVLLWLPLGFAAVLDTGDSCGDCYRFDTVTLIGVVIGDVLLTVIIILVVYYCTKQTYEKRNKDADKKVYMNMPIRGK